MSLPEELIVELDEAAKTLYMSRTEYIRYVLHKAVGGKYPDAVNEVAKEKPTRFLDLDG